MKQLITMTILTGSLFMAAEVLADHQRQGHDRSHHSQHHRDHDKSRKHNKGKANKYREKNHHNANHYGQKGERRSYDHKRHIKPKNRHHKHRVYNQYHRQYHKHYRHHYPVVQYEWGRYGECLQVTYKHRYRYYREVAPRACRRHAW